MPGVTEVIRELRSLNDPVPTLLRLPTAEEVGDYVIDCVIACVNFLSESIHFDVEEAVVIPDA